MKARVIIISIWVLCCTLSYGALYAHFRALDNHARDSEEADHLGSFWLSLWGPVSLMFAALFTQFARHGFTWRRDPHRRNP